MRKSEANKNMRHKAGFTLIELLVVIAIIGLLAVISALALNSTRSRARDARRLADITQISIALEMYYNNNGVYPQCGAGNSKDLSGSWYSCLEPALSPYMRKLPSDPLEKGGGYNYSASPLNSAQGVLLHFYLENANPNLSNAFFAWYGDNYGYAYFREIGRY